MTIPLSRKKIIFLTRLVVIITVSYFILFIPSADKDSDTYKHFFIAFYLLTNLIVAYIPEKYFYDNKVFYGIILGDSVLVLAGIYISGYVGSDLYLIYFFLVSLTTIGSRFQYLMISTIIFRASTAGCYTGTVSSAARMPQAMPSVCLLLLSSQCFTVIS